MTLHEKHRLRLFLIIIATIFYFLANIQRVAIPGAVFNFLQSDFMCDASKITMLGAVFCYVYALTQLVVGMMVDKFGGFRVIAIGCIIFALGAVISPCAHDIIQFYIARACLGFGAATFYLSTIREVKKYSKDKNFSLAISYILFIGYSGGIIANAPFVSLVVNVGWRSAMLVLAIFSLALAILYIFLLYTFKPTHIEKKVKFSFSPFREILTNKKNIYLYIFGCTNYGLYYVLQSVIGNKFLQDFCMIETKNTALVLSIMALISAFAGTITAYISRLLNNRRAIIFKTFALFSMITMLIVCIFLALNLHFKLIAAILCIPAFIGSISPLLILSLHMINRYEISAVAVSIQNFLFFMMVGILGMISGILMNVFEPIKQNGILIYSNQSYLLVFSLFLILSIIEVVCALQIKD